MSPAASNGPTEGQNFRAKQVKRAGRGFKTLKNYELRVLLYTGGVAWPVNPSPQAVTDPSPLIWEDLPS
ncbi:MAG: transposase [Acidimicrobiales bacterium]